MGLYGEKEFLGKITLTPLKSNTLHTKSRLVFNWHTELYLKIRFLGKPRPNGRCNKSEQKRKKARGEIFFELTVALLWLLPLATYYRIKNRSIKIFPNVKPRQKGSFWLLRCFISNFFVVFDLKKGKYGKGFLLGLKNQFWLGWTFMQVLLD